jgi:hypothetical protein
MTLLMPPVAAPPAPPLLFVARVPPVDPGTPPEALPPAPASSLLLAVVNAFPHDASPSVAIAPQSQRVARGGLICGKVPSLPGRVKSPRSRRAAAFWSCAMTGVNVAGRLT